MKRLREKGENSPCLDVELDLVVRLMRVVLIESSGF